MATPGEQIKEMAWPAEDEVDDEDNVKNEIARMALMPTREEQQRENKAWQDVYDTPERKQSETRNMLLEVRDQCSGADGRLDGAERMKAEANEQYSKGEYALALRSYVTALWLTNLDDPPLPKLLSDPAVPSGPALVAVLSANIHSATAAEELLAAADAAEGGYSGCTLKEAQELLEATRPAEAAPSAEGVTKKEAQDRLFQQLVEAEGSAAPSAAGVEEEVWKDGRWQALAKQTEGWQALCSVRTALRLNVAAASLKLEEWHSAKAACEVVLSEEPNQAKALYRLAQAHEGLGELSSAISVLKERLLKHEPSHREAAKLLRTLKERNESERKMFGGLFDRAQGAGTELDGLYSDVAVREDARKRKEEKEKLLKLENVAKLPTEMWADVMGDASEREHLMEKLRKENKELASSMEDGQWQKHLANMSVEEIETAKAAVELHKKREARKAERKAAGLPEEEEEETDGGEEDEEDSWMDTMITYVGLGLAGVTVVVAIGIAMWQRWQVQPELATPGAASGVNLVEELQGSSPSVEL